MKRPRPKTFLWLTSLLATLMSLAFLNLALASDPPAEKQAVHKSDSGLRYLGLLHQAERAAEAMDFGRLRQLLEAAEPPAHEDDLRGWEWSYLQGLVQAHGQA